MTGPALDLWADELLICADSGCRPARLLDLAEVIQLLPEFLRRQDRAAQRRQWLRMVDEQRRAPRADLQR